jgi:hypothetical protein
MTSFDSGISIYDAQSNAYVGKSMVYLNGYMYILIDKIYKIDMVNQSIVSSFTVSGNLFMTYSSNMHFKIETDGTHLYTASKKFNENVGMHDNLIISKISQNGTILQENFYSLSYEADFQNMFIKNNKIYLYITGWDSDVVQGYIQLNVINLVNGSLLNTYRSYSAIESIYAFDGTYAYANTGVLSKIDLEFNVMENFSVYLENRPDNASNFSFMNNKIYIMYNDRIREFNSDFTINAQGDEFYIFGESQINLFSTESNNSLYIFTLDYNTTTTPITTIPIASTSTPYVTPTPTPYIVQPQPPQPPPVRPPPTPNSIICFIEDTMIDTDQGKVAIQLIEPGLHTIRSKPVLAVTKTVSIETELIRIPIHSIGNDAEIVSSLHHLMFHDGTFKAAKELPGVERIPYQGQFMYNILMEEHDIMVVHGVPCETLHPKNPIAKLFMIVKEDKLTLPEQSYLFSRYNQLSKIAV